jgi:peptide/nickel transport system permease protein
MSILVSDTVKRGSMKRKSRNLARRLLSQCLSFVGIPMGKNQSGLTMPDSTTGQGVGGWKEALYRFRRNPLSLSGLVIVAALVIMGLVANYLAPYPQDALGAVNFANKLQGPSTLHWFGTDEVGRDVLSRIMFGARIDLASAVVVQVVVGFVGVTLGMLAGYAGGKVNLLIMRAADIFISIPPLVLALVATTAFKPDLTTAMLAVTIAWWPWMARVVQSAVLSVKEEQYIEASRAVGKSPFGIIFNDIFPNIVSVITVKMTLDIGTVILFMASLSFLGLGVQPPTPAWGTMITEGRAYLPEAWWMSTFPGIFILLAVIGFNLLGDGLRDALDVQLGE